MAIRPLRGFRTLATVTFVTAALLVTGAAVLPTAADAQSAPSTSFLTNIRGGRHATFDRVVLDFSGPVPATPTSQWVRTLVADASGQRVPLPGNKFLRVVGHSAAASLGGRSTYPGRTRFTTPQLRNVRAVALVGDFEGVLSVGLGVRHTSWVHVFTLTGPSRLVIDVGR
jgi:hypothetical protein